MNYLCMWFVFLWSCFFGFQSIWVSSMSTGCTCNKCKLHLPISNIHYALSMRKSMLMMMIIMTSFVVFFQQFFFDLSFFSSFVFTFCHARYTHIIFVMLQEMRDQITFACEIRTKINKKRKMIRCFSCNRMTQLMCTLSCFCLIIYSLYNLQLPKCEYTHRVCPFIEERKLSFPENYGRWRHRMPRGHDENRLSWQ